MAVNAIDWEPVDFQRPDNPFFDQGDANGNIIPAGFNPQNAVLRRPQPPVIDLEEEQIDTTIDPEQLLDQSKAALYSCLCCWMIADNPHVHPYRDCQTFLCRGCFDNILSAIRPNYAEKCPRKCHSTRFEDQCVPLNNINNVIAGRSLTEYFNLWVKCKNDGCTTTIQLRYYKEHLLHYCAFDPNFCVNCKEIFKDHICPLLVSSLEAQISDLKRENQLLRDENELIKTLEELKLQNTKLKVQMEEIVQENDRLHLRNLELRQQSSLPNSQESTSGQPSSSRQLVRGLSNHIRVTQDYRNHQTHFIVKYGDQTVDIHNLSLEATGKDLRNQIQQSLRCEVGDILKLEHTPIRDNIRLKQHQLSTKPIHLIALPSYRWIPRGTTLNVNVGSNGPTI